MPGLLCIRVWPWLLPPSWTALLCALARVLQQQWGPPCPHQEPCWTHLQKCGPRVCRGPLAPSSSSCPHRYDLDACDIQEKYPDLFQVSLEVEVQPRDQPSREAPPWESTSMRGLNPKILFSSREEQQDILAKFGESRLRS